MRASRYFQLAHSAAKCEEFGNLSEAAVLWHQATELAVRKANRDWSAHRANVWAPRKTSDSINDGKKNDSRIR